jgi:Tol biopolymer transport system component
MKAALVVTAFLLVPSLFAEENQPPSAVFDVQPAPADGRISGASPLTVSFNLCRSRDEDADDELKYSYDFNGDGTLDYFGHCRQSYTYTSERAAESCWWRPIVCVWDRQPFPGHQVCRQYDVCVTAEAAAPTPTPGASAGRIAFVSARNSGDKIFFMNADGTNVTALGGGSARDFEFAPSWSPDGRTFAFVRGDPTGLPAIFVMGSDGRQTRVVTGESPALSPDSRRMVFKAPDDHAHVLHIVNVDGSDERLLMSGATFPAWSPDGRRIAFTMVGTGIPATESSEIFLINPDGSDLVALTTGGWNYSPAWSPDGRRIAFTSMRSSNADVYVMNADGSGRTRLTTDPASDSWPTWSPDGSQIAFMSNRDGSTNSEIYVMSANGGAATNLTASPGNDNSPAWQPQPK